jgi:hypothetical protein
MRRDRARPVPVPVPDGSRVGSGRSVIPRRGLSPVGVSCVIAPKLIEWSATLSSGAGDLDEQSRRLNCVATAVP